MSPQGIAKIETLKPSMIEEFLKVNELPQVQVVNEESIILHVEDEAFKEELCDFMRVEDKRRSMEKQLGKESPIRLSLILSLMCYEVSFSTFSRPFCEVMKFETHKSCVVNFQGLQVGANIVQEIKEWLTSKSAFEERSFYGFTSFYKNFIKDLSTIASLLMDVPKKMTGFTWKICLPLIEFPFNQVHHSSTRYSPFEVDYVYNFLTPLDMISLSVDHALNLEGKTKTEFVNSSYSKNLDIIKDNNKKFGKI
ncbi:hypothetical protein M9H77_16884 [Catharanthus roseus]|uniref:Uncharacterized protein n=1 Tax=Catharanthus roseus TaxID=4058 RepID=A0ACC0B319_CATRO|nr:hypothetical protein M9H77_16884 [Catharanthus roseus]